MQHDGMATLLSERPWYTYPTAEQMLFLNFLMCSLFSAEWSEYLKCKSVKGNIVWKKASFTNQFSYHAKNSHEKASVSDHEGNIHTIMYMYTICWLHFSIHQQFPVRVNPSLILILLQQ